ncbi:hypothetical protein VTJ04DRAFT_4781 [Mycothermus thermophilus]|uniref:uncharacterized protein n=1 Tax=Humicola insolens TaxID=85995 RepID=UPI0037423047
MSPTCSPPPDASLPEDPAPRLAVEFQTEEMRFRGCCIQNAGPQGEDLPSPLHINKQQSVSNPQPHLRAIRNPTLDNVNSLMPRRNSTHPLLGDSSSELTDSPGTTPVTLPKRRGANQGGWVAYPAVGCTTDGQDRGGASSSATSWVPKQDSAAAGVDGTPSPSPGSMQAEARCRTAASSLRQSGCLQSTPAQGPWVDGGSRTTISTTTPTTIIPSPSQPQDQTAGHGSNHTNPLRPAGLSMLPPQTLDQDADVSSPNKTDTSPLSAGYMRFEDKKQRIMHSPVVGVVPTIAALPPMPFYPAVAATGVRAPSQPFVLVPQITVTPEVETVGDGPATVWAAVQVSAHLRRPDDPDGL